MSSINDIAFVERVDELEGEGNLTVGGNILLHGKFPKLDQKIVDLNTTIGYKANQSDMDEMEITLKTKANQADIDKAFSLTDGQIDAVNALLDTKATQVDIENAAAIISVFIY